MKPLINILIRTADRRNFFNKCVESILEQSYTNIKIIVHVDSDETMEYVKSYTNSMKVIVSVREGRISPRHCPYNLYMNKLMDEVSSGYILFLDDDNFLKDKDAIQHLVDNIVDESILLMFKVRMDSGRILPEPEFFGNIPIRKHIDTSCFLFHSKWKDLAKWDNARAGDFRFISNIYNIIPRVKWINDYFIQMGNNGSNGDLKDL